MNTKEKYDAIISSVETCIQEEKGAKPGKIADIVCKKAGYSPRVLGNIFDFLTGRPLIKYITERQMMYAYRSIIEGDFFNWETAIGFSYTPSRKHPKLRFHQKYMYVIPNTPSDIRSSKNMLSQISKCIAVGQKI